MTAEELSWFMMNYYRGADRQRLVDALLCAARERHFPDPMARYLTLYFFSRVAQFDRTALTEYQQLLEDSHPAQRLTSPGERDFLATLCWLAPEDRSGKPPETLPEHFPLDFTILDRPVRTCADLDYLWTEFSVTGGREPVLKAIEVLRWPDRIRARLQRWLETPAKSPLQHWRRRRALRRLRRVAGIVCEPEGKTIAPLRDLDCLCTVGSQSQREHGSQFPLIRAALPFSLSEDDVAYVVTKGAARWSLLSWTDHVAVRDVWRSEMPDDVSSPDVKAWELVRREYEARRLAEAHPSVAFQEELRSAQEGNAAAQTNVAAFYASGSGVAQDYGEALRWWRRAAEQGVVEAQFGIGTLYGNGWGVPKDQREAAMWYRQAADHGHPSAQYNLGLSYMEGQGVPPDVAQAYVCFDRAAAGYQRRIDSGLDMRKHRQDAIRQRRRARWSWLILRCRLFLASLGLGQFRPLHHAAVTGNVDLARHLVEKGANVNARDKYGDTPLKKAAFWGNRVVAELLIANGANVDAAEEDGFTALWAAAQNGHRSLVELLLENGADVNGRCKGDRTPLFIAAGNGRTSVVEVLIEHGADIHARDRDGFAALHAAAHSGQTETAELLLAKGVGVDPRAPDDVTPLFTAASRGHTAVAHLFITKGADVRAQIKPGGTTPLHMAALNGYDALVRLLIDFGADVNARSREGLTPLHSTAFEGYPSTAELLIAAGADVNARTDDGLTPLRIAARNGHRHLVAVLHKHAC